jgi:hypothetical protein
MAKNHAMDTSAGIRLASNCGSSMSAWREMRDRTS